MDPFAVGFDQMIDHLAGAVNIIVDYVIARFVFAFSEQKQVRMPEESRKLLCSSPVSMEVASINRQSGGSQAYAPLLFLLYVGMRVGEDNAIALFRRHFSTPSITGANNDSVESEMTRPKCLCLVGTQAFRDGIRPVVKLFNELLHLPRCFLADAAVSPQGFRHCSRGYIQFPRLLF